MTTVAVLNDPCLRRRLRGFRHALDEFGERIELWGWRECEDAWTIRRSLLARLTGESDTKRIEKEDAR